MHTVDNYTPCPLFFFTPVIFICLPSPHNESDYGDNKNIHFCRFQSKYLPFWLYTLCQVIFQKKTEAQQVQCSSAMSCFTQVMTILLLLQFTQPTLLSSVRRGDENNPSILIAR
jgi:hypothetical protein